MRATLPPMDGGTDVDRDDPEGAIQPSQGSEPPRVAVYAAAAGLATAVPVPFVDRALSGLARGAALRRVAKRRGVRLSRDARDILSGGRTTSSLKGRWLRSALASALAPIRIASRIDDAVSTWAAAIVLDHHLVTATRDAHAPLTRDEAVAIRRAMDSAEVDTVLESLRVAPQGFVTTLARAARSAAELDIEGRSPLERIVDTLLDAAAEAPDGVIGRLHDAFDRAMDEAARDDE